MTPEEFADKCNALAEAMHKADDRLPLVKAYTRMDGSVVLHVEGFQRSVSATQVRKELLLPFVVVRSAICAAHNQRINQAELKAYAAEAKEKQ